MDRYLYSPQGVAGDVYRLALLGNITGNTELFAAFVAVPAWLRKDDPKDRDKQIEKDLKEYEEDLVPVKTKKGRRRTPNKFDKTYKITKDHRGEDLPPEEPGQAMRTPDLLRLERDQQRWRRDAREALRRRRTHKNNRRTRFYRPLWAVGWAILFAFPALIAMNHVYPVPVGLDPSFQLRRPWTPPEVLTTKSGFREVGYVLAAEDRWSVILTEKQRTIDYLPSEEIADRSVCSIERVETPDVGPLIHLPGVHESTSPPCPTSHLRTDT